MDLSTLEEKLGYVFKDKKFLEAALDWRTRKTSQYLLDSKGLEYLGDKLIHLIVAEDLTDHLPHYREARGTIIHNLLVSNATFSEIANSIGITEYVLREKGEPLSKKHPADAFEAIAYAIYLDAGRDLDITRTFVRNHLMPRIGAVAAKIGGRRRPVEAIFVGQVWERYKTMPEYQYELQAQTEIGKCIVHISANGERLSTGISISMTAAKQAAILNALENFRNDKNPLKAGNSDTKQF